jgi:hypothetical protein
MRSRVVSVAVCGVTLPAFALAAGVTVSVNTAKPGAVITNKILGANMANWYDITQSGLASSLKTTRFNVLRWPGGSASDTFHWQTNTECNGGYVDTNSTFDAFMADVAKPAGADVGVTLNYGSNAACNAGGDPTEAAAWVTYAAQKGYNVTHWTVGNEVYGSWEYDLHSVPHDPTTYANAVATGYYPDIKQANPKALVGVVVNPGNSPPWDPIVLSTAKYDFVEYHYYAQAPGQESDSYLVGSAAHAFAQDIAAVKADLKSAGHASTPIYVGELGSVYSNPGKQTSSITQALFAGQVLGEMMNAGVARATWWLGYGGCSDASSGNFSSSLYGWQSFGGYMLFSDGLPEYGCSSAPALARGVPLPTVRVFQVMSLIAHGGEHALPTTVSGTGVRAYAATQGTGTAVALFNTSETASASVTVSIGSQASSGSVVETVYDKAIYDRSKNGVWAGPATTKLGAVTLPLTVTLSPWSTTVLQIGQ